MYTKTITITATGKLERNVALSTREEPKYGWSITPNGCRCLTLPATEAEYSMYWHGYIWTSLRAMRSIDSVEYLKDYIHGQRIKVITTTFIPNRSQRKHNCRII